MIGRYHLKFIFLAIIIFLIILYCKQYISYKNDTDKLFKCVLFNKFSNCLIDKNNVYLPASQIMQIFDIHGYMDKYENTYYLKHNNVQYVRNEKYLYDSRGKYLFFNKYNVELRPKVKWISTDEGVPISIQWNVNGYKYPIQIAQFGLSHYSKWIVLKEKKDIVKPLDLLKVKSAWDPSISNNKNVKLSKDGLTFFSVQVITEEVLLGLSTFMHYGNELYMNDITEYISILPFIDSLLPELYIVGTEWVSGSAIHIKIKNKSIKDLHILYVCGDFHQSQTTSSVFIYAIKDCTHVKLVRNLYVDIMKIIPVNLFDMNPHLETALKSSWIDGIFIYGQGKISTFKICNQFSYEKFLISADWLLLNQDKNGGWPTNVTRRIYSNVKLNPGWYSAMAQGHGISVLMRAYHSTNNIQYMDAASNALNLFEINSTNNGIRTHFLGNDDLVWYEEYPTKPSLFVLNGFLYSLFGLIDYNQISSSEFSKQKSENLFKLGMTSLQALLPLFDSGFGSFYDLRHVSFPAGNVQVYKANVRPWEVHGGPNRARWEYHIIHIEQLLYLTSVIYPKNKLLTDTAERFILYLKGYRSAHN